MRIAITGATGLVGRRLTGRLLGRGDEVVALTRSPDRAREALPPAAEARAWAVDDLDAAVAALAGTDAVVNLAGEGVLDRRWNAEVMEEIRRSRVQGTRTVVAAMRAAKDGPRVLVNASAVGFYGDRPDAELDESAPPGSDFLARVCVDWEAEAARVAEFGARWTAVRIGIVLAREGGALPRMIPPFRWFVGGPIGRGRQGFPWIHVDDLAGILQLALDRDEVTGPVNAAGPEMLNQRAFSRALGRVLRRPSWLPVPRIALRLLVGKASRVLTAGQLVVPRRAREAGYEFRFPTAETALRDLIGRD